MVREFTALVKMDDRPLSTLTLLKNAVQSPQRKGEASPTGKMQQTLATLQKRSEECLGLLDQERKVNEKKQKTIDSLEMAAAHSRTQIAQLNADLTRVTTRTQEQENTHRVLKQAQQTIHTQQEEIDVLEKTVAELKAANWEHESTFRDEERAIGLHMEQMQARHARELAAKDAEVVAATEAAARLEAEMRQCEGELGAYLSTAQATMAEKEGAMAELRALCHSMENQFRGDIDALQMDARWLREAMKGQEAAVKDLQGDKVRLPCCCA